MNDTLLIAFIAVTSVAVVLQTLILAGMYFSTRKMGQRVEALSIRVEEQVLPLVDKVRGMVDENAPMIHTVISNLTETSLLVRTQASHIDGVLTEIVDMTRAQAGRADQLVTRTMQRVENTAGALQQTVSSPMRHVSALADGVTAGFGKYMQERKARRANAAPGDETI